MNDLTHISLFSGLGGADIAAEWAGFRTVLFCEIDPFCQAVLRKHWPGVPLIGDVSNVTRETVADATVRQVNQRISRGMGQETSSGGCGNAAAGSGNINDGIYLTLLSAGVPCQPASTAGKRRGKADDRWLWPEAIRVLGELRPTWAVFENPFGIASLGEYGGLSELAEGALESLGDREAVELDNICRDIEAHGYEVQPVCIPACAVGAPHRRDRIFIVAHTRQLQRGQSEGQGILGPERPCREAGAGDQQADAADAASQRRQNRSGMQPGIHRQPQGVGQGEGLRGYCGWEGTSWPSVAARTCRVDDELSSRLDLVRRQRVQRLKALGNAIVPAQIWPIFRAIADISGNS